MSSKVKRGIMWPIAIAVLLGRWVKRLFVTPKSAKELRVIDKAHQSAVRRELRGLPAEHDAAAAVPDQAVTSPIARG